MNFSARPSLKNKLLRSLAVLALAMTALSSAHAESVVPVEDFSVFVDLPTGFAYIKTPSGWRFVRRIEASRLGELHPSTLVSLVQAGETIGDKFGDKTDKNDDKTVVARAGK